VTYVGSKQSRSCRIGGRVPGPVRSGPQYFFNNPTWNTSWRSYMEHIVEAHFRRQLQLVHVPIEPPRAKILNGQKNLGLACRESGRVWRPPGDAAAAAIPTAQPQTPCRGGSDRSMTCISAVPAPDAHEFQPGTHHVLKAAGGRWADVLPPVCMSAQRGITPVHNFER
jgi:hypothetical protein